MNYAAIKLHDAANGPGTRVCLFVSGCTHHCKGCFNQEAWDFTYGQPYTEETENYLLKELAFPYCAGLTLLGGEPMEPVNQRGLVQLLRRFRQQNPKKTVWCFTGYLYDEDLQPGGRVYTEVTDEMLSLIDVIVDGEYKEEQHDITLLFKGSANQRTIDVKKSRESGSLVFWEPEGISIQKMTRI